MINRSPIENQILEVASFEELIETPFQGAINALCWKRQLQGDFAEIVTKAASDENIIELHPKQLRALQLSEQGQLAREILLKDLSLLKAQGASPVLNLIKYYDRDDAYSFFPTDVYSFHVDRSPIPTATYLCTYYGEPSEILPNTHAEQKIRITEIRAELKKLYDGADEGFESFLSDYFFDLHHQAKLNANPLSLGLGHLWRLAVDHPESKVLPCIHRAPLKKNGKPRLLLIC